MHFIDLTHTFELPMPVYPGDLEPEFMVLASIKQDGMADTQVSTGMHVGTHIDAPGHMIQGGKKLSDYSVDRFFGRGVLVDARGKTRIDGNLLREIALQSGDMVLVLTGWSKWYRSGVILSPAKDPDSSALPQNDRAKDYFADFPIVEESFAERLVDAGVSLVGFDFPSPDDVEQDPDNLYPIHRLLLEADILIAENLNHVDQLANVADFEVIALPAKFATDGAPARVIARVQQEVRSEK